MNNFRQPLINEPYEDLPSRAKRRKLILGMYLFYIVPGGIFFSVLSILSSLKGLPSIIWGIVLNGSMYLAIIGMVIGMICFYKLREITGKVTELPEKDLDERQKMVRYRAYARAYRVISVVALFPALYIYLRSLFLGRPFGFELPLPGASASIILFLGMMLIIVALPMSIIAWTE